jgi:type II secretory pathway pseudopilin PulG
MAVLLVGIAVMGVLMSVAMPVWRQASQREKEEELIFRGEQYARAVALFQRKFAGAYAPSVDVLVEQKFLRKKYKDPINKNEDFQVVFQISGQRPGQPTVAPGGTPQPQPPAGPGSPSTPAAGARGGVLGVMSKSQERSIRLYKGRGRYSEWQFVYAPAVAPGPGGTPQPGQVPGQGQPGQGVPGAPVPGGRPGPGQPFPRTGSPSPPTGQPPIFQPREPR